MENQEREISLGKLFCKLAFGWRCLLVWALIFTVLITLMFYIKDKNTYSKAQEIDKVEENNYSFTEDQKEQMKNVVSLEDMISVNETYIKESILMNIDPYEENVLLLKYYVDSDYQFNYTENNSLDYTGSLVAAYNEYIKNGDVVQKIAEVLERENEKKYVDELISVQPAESGAVFTVKIIYQDKEVLRQISEIIKTEVNKETERFNETIGGHTLKLLSENITIMNDTELAALQRSNFDILNTYKAQLNALKLSMTKEQLEQLAKSTEAEEDEGLTLSTPLTRPTLRIKYMVLGFGAGFFLAAMWIVLRILFSGRIWDTKELAARYGLYQFGVLNAPERISGIDKLLVKLKNRNKKQMNQEQCIDMVSSNIELYCKAEGISKVFLTGTEIEHMDKSLFQSVIAKMNEAGIKTVYGENVCYDAKSLRQLVEIKCVILIEQEDVSKYQEIEKEIKAAIQQNVKILGYIGIKAKNV